jgi:hypothetical protein
MPFRGRQPPAPVLKDSDRVLVRLTVIPSPGNPVTIIVTLDEASAREFGDYTHGATIEADATVRGSLQLPEGQLWPERKSFEQQLIEYQTALENFTAMQRAVQATGSYRRSVQIDPAAMRLWLTCRWIQIKGKPSSLVLGEGPRRPSTSTNSPILSPMPTVVTKDVTTNSLGMVFVPVPRTEVRFCVGETRVRDYAVYALANREVDGSWRNPGFVQADDQPVVGVSWSDAQAFCKWLTSKERAEGRISASQVYRLPLDWEWSMAIGLPEPRGVTPREKDGKVPGYPWGMKWPPPKGVENLGCTPDVDDFHDTSPVGSFPANPQGCSTSTEMRENGARMSTTRARAEEPGCCVDRGGWLPVAAFGPPAGVLHDRRNAS